MVESSTKFKWIQGQKKALYFFSGLSASGIAKQCLFCYIIDIQYKRKEPIDMKILSSYEMKLSGDLKSLESGVGRMEREGSLSSGRS